MNRKKLLMLFAILILMVALIIFSSVCCINVRMGDIPSKAECERYSFLPNYKDGIFVNQEEMVISPELKKKSVFGFFRFLGRSENAPPSDLPMINLKKDSFTETPSEYAVYWLGHSAIIFELGGKRFMTDPVFGYASPVPFAGNRYSPPPMERKEMPPLDFIIITHDHYDHLEYDTIRFLRDKQVPFVVPLGVGSILRGWGIESERIHELNWDDSITLDGITVTAQTARHFSARSMNNRNRTLWASFVIEGAGRKIYLGADGGYGRHFQQIGEKYGPFNLVCLEIDAWNELWPNSHLFPCEAVRAYNELKGENFLPIHWGVFDLAMHPWNKSINALVEEIKETDIRLLTPKMGEKIIPGTTVTEKWWLSVQGK